MKQIIVALGGNALIRGHEIGKYKQQKKNVERSCKQIAKLIKRGHSVVITHGNGPQVGNLQIQMGAASKLVPAMPLHVDVAMTQAQIGYMIQQSLKNLLPGKKVVTVVTEVVVSHKDKAFRNPTKPIGPYYKKPVKGVKMVKQRRGWRKVVASPKPLKVVQLKEIKDLLRKGAVVVACGGGGIPVAKKRGKLQGVEAVIDKDAATQLLANSLGIKEMYVLTDVKYAKVNFGKKNERNLKKVKLKELKKYLREGEFAAGSMKPKIEAAIRFIEKGGKRVVITSLNKLGNAVYAGYGTVVTK